MERDPSGGQLDSQREAVQPRAQLRQDGTVVGSESEVGVHRASPLDEQLDSFGPLGRVAFHR